ncbi:MAG TPA: transporter substrate-binding domain-containing protein [Candidatus Ozemobacteraceae bacterium]
MRRNIDLVVFLCCALIVFAICLEPLEERVIPDTWAQIRQEETIRIGFSYEPPHAYLDAQGEPTGEAIETARQVVAGMGIKNIDWRMRDFATLLDRLQQREFDVVAASMYMTPQRRRRVAFSNPSLQLLPGLLVKAGNPLRIHSYEDLGRIPGVRIVALDGGVETGILQEVGISSRSVTLVQNIDLGVSAMIADQADVFPLTAYTARRIIDNERSPRYELANPFTLPQMLISDRFNCGFAFRKEDVALQSAWNHVQRGIIGSPAHLAILDRFELGRECLPGGGRRYGHE